MKNTVIRNRKVLIITLAAVVGAFVLYKVLGTFLFSRFNLDSITELFLSEVFFAVIIFAAAFLTHRIQCLKPTGRGFGIGILVGLWFVIVPVISLSANLFMGFVEEVSVSAGHIILFIAAMLMIGINEELLFRGILLNGMLEAFGEDSPARIRAAVFISGGFFGLIHIFNVFSGASFGGALIQAVVNMAAGALFGAAYVRSGKNLWPTILLHAFMDACAMIIAGVLAGKDYVSSISSYSPVMLVTAALEIGIAIFALRKKKLLPFVKEK